jgi:hypothetical protein
MSKHDTKVGSDVMQDPKEVRVHQRGEIALPSRKLDVPSRMLMTVIEWTPHGMEDAVTTGCVG